MLSASEVAERIDVNPKTVRRYWSAHKLYLDWDKQGNGPLLFHPNSVKTLFKIRDLYNKDRLTKHEVQKVLQEEEAIVVKTREDVPVSHGGTAAISESTIDKYAQFFIALEQQNKLLVQQLSQHQNFFMEESRKRDQEFKMYLERDREKDRKREEEQRKRDTEQRKMFEMMLTQQNEVMVKLVQQITTTPEQKKVEVPAPSEKVETPAPLEEMPPRRVKQKKEKGFISRILDKFR